MGEFDRVAEAIAWIRQASDRRPLVGIVLGSGLGDFAGELENATFFNYGDIPHFQVPKVAGHQGRLGLGRIGCQEIAVLQGRCHYYEGFDIRDVVFPVRVLSGLGIRILLLTNTAGAINPELAVGDLMIIRDHINLMGVNPLRGENDDRLGPRFPDMSHVYNPALQDAIAACLRVVSLPARRGVYAALSGPSYETPAEIRMLRTLGADAVGMSTVPEAIAGQHQNLQVAGISCITNLAAGLSAKQPSHEEVMTAAGKLKNDFTGLLHRLLKGMEQSP